MKFFYSTCLFISISYSLFGQGKVLCSRGVSMGGYGDFDFEQNCFIECLAISVRDTSELMASSSSIQNTYSDFEYKSEKFNCLIIDQKKCLCYDEFYLEINGQEFPFSYPMVNYYYKLEQTSFNEGVNICSFDKELDIKQKAAGSVFIEYKRKSNKSPILVSLDELNSDVSSENVSSMTFFFLPIQIYGDQFLEVPNIKVEGSY